MFFWDYGNAFLLEAQRAGKSFHEHKHTQYTQMYYSLHIRIKKRLGFVVFIGAEVEKIGGGATEFRYPSYVQHIMG